MVCIKLPFGHGRMLRKNAFVKRFSEVLYWVERVKLTKWHRLGNWRRTELFNRMTCCAILLRNGTATLNVRLNRHLRLCLHDNAGEYAEKTSLLSDASSIGKTPLSSDSANAGKRRS